MLRDAKYCYWGVATGPTNRANMARCIKTARSVGDYHQFQVFTDEEIKGEYIECYEAGAFLKDNGLFKFFFLKEGIERLTFDFFVYLDSDTIFRRRPRELLSLLRHSPIHVPLETATDGLNGELTWQGRRLCEYNEHLVLGGVFDRPLFLVDGGFWIFRRDVIGRVMDLAAEFWRLASRRSPTGGGPGAVAARDVHKSCGRDPGVRNDDVVWCPGSPHHRQGL